MESVSPIYKIIHSKFKFNGIHYDFGDLKELAYSLVKEGQDYEFVIGNFLLYWLDDSDSIRVNTSGSTGIPKIISLQKEHMVNSALATGAFFNLGPGAKALNCLPTSFIAGKMMLVRAMVLGWEMDFVEPSSNPLKLSSKSYDFSAMVPMQAQNSISYLNKIGTLIIGGAPISPELKLSLSQSSTKIFETYGMTETITHIAVKQIVGDSVTINSFKTLPGIVLFKDDRDCLVIQAPHTMDNNIITNDVVDLISSSEFQWLGRYDNIINSGGVKLIPEQIENKLSSLIKSRFFVSGITDASLGHKIVLVVEGTVDGAQLLQDIKALNRLSKYEIPKEIYSVSQFPETGSGKINRTRTLLELSK